MAKYSVNLGFTVEDNEELTFSEVLSAVLNSLSIASDGKKNVKIGYGSNEKTVTVTQNGLNLYMDPIYDAAPLMSEPNVVR